jgi:hypothetical protein
MLAVITGRGRTSQNGEIAQAPRDFLAVIRHTNKLANSGKIGSFPPRIGLNCRGLALQPGYEFLELKAGAERVKGVLGTVGVGVAVACPDGLS